MKKFAGNKPIFTIKAQCKAAGVAYDDYNFRVKGADYACLGIAHGVRPDGSPYVPGDSVDGVGYVMYNTFNGTFFGRTPEGVRFSSSSTHFEAEPWFQALLSFFYVEKGEKAAPHRTTSVGFTLGGAALLKG